MTDFINPLNVPDLSFDLRTIRIVSKNSYKADALIIPANGFVVLENLSVKFHRPIWVVKPLNMFNESLAYGKYLIEERENEPLTFSDWLVEQGFFDINKKADVRQDIVNVYGTSFNFFCFGTKESFKTILSNCPALNDEHKNMLFSVVRIYENITDNQKAILLDMLRRINDLQIIHKQFIVVEVFKKIREIGKLGEKLDKEAFMYFMDFIRKYENQKAQYKYSDLINTLISHTLTRIVAVQINNYSERDEEDEFNHFYENIETLEFIHEGKVKPILFYKGSLERFHINFFISDMAYSSRRVKIYLASVLAYLNKNINSPLGERIRIRKYNEDILFKIKTVDKDLLIPAVTNNGIYKLNSGSNVEIKILSTK